MTWLQIWEASAGPQAPQGYKASSWVEKRQGDLVRRASFARSPVQIRVAIPAADPPDNLT
jgi:hypothetical protein